ncbi:MAG TPA: leucyl aminopeptidase, partial [Erysipelothrix sp.]|nr:leucyl aminopeptidase [Erysipelothrix sp.]
VYTLGKLKAPVIYFVGMGYKDEANFENIKENFAKALKSIEEDELVIDLKRIVTDDLSLEVLAEIITESILLSNYDYKKEDTTHYELLAKQDIKQNIESAKITSTAINRAKTLANTPPNHMTPLDLEQEVINLFAKEDVEISILDNAKLKEIKAGGILGVNKGSIHEARLIVLKYNGANDEDYTALIGKGVTFDTGGYSLKPSNSMGMMKTDMHGAASVLGAFEIIVKKKMKANVYCIIPTTENMISGEAYKVDDVLTMLNGKTVEITNTDAEGRLILADALTYAQTLNAKSLIDVATLTGACVVGIGSDHTGVWSNNDAFYDKFLNTALDAGELTWRMPLHDVFNQPLKSSPVADLVNSAAPKGGGANVAASFLSEFVNKDIDWIHLDIAGTSSTKEKTLFNPKGATGVMVKTLAHYFEK